MGNLRDGYFWWGICFLRKVCESRFLSSTRKDEPLPFGLVLHHCSRSAPALVMAPSSGHRWNTKGAQTSFENFSPGGAQKTFAIEDRGEVAVER